MCWHDSSLYNSCGAEIEEDSDDDTAPIRRGKESVHSQTGVMVGIVSKDSIERSDAIPVNFLDWSSKTNKRIVESSFAAETQAAVVGLGRAQYVRCRCLLCELLHGKESVTDERVCFGESLMKISTVTDCRSVYDCVLKESSTPDDRRTAISVASLRQGVSAGSGRDLRKSALMWVPTRCQIADGLTKSGLAKSMRAILEAGERRLHELSKKALRARGRPG